MDPIIVNGWDFTHVLTAAEVAARFGVDNKTVGRWGSTGRLASIQTLGGHRRYSRQQIDHLRNRRS